MVTFAILLLVLVFVVLPTWIVIKLLGLARDHEALNSELYVLRRDIAELRAKLDLTTNQPAAPETSVLRPAPVAAPAARAPVVASSEIPPPPAPVAPPVYAAQSVAHSTAEPALPPTPPPVLSEEPLPPPSRIDWEQFMGAKLSAWLGGLAALLGVALFVKYSFEHDLIPPEVRVALGFLFALGLVIGGLKIDRERYRITAQTLCATGVVSLYAVTFACNSVYHFAFFGLVPTFLLMVLITATAFLLAVRLDARVVAVLGMLGGFLTPVLLSTGRDNPAGLFGYLAVLNIGLIAVALHRRWHFLVGLGTAGTVLMQFGWADKFLEAAKAPVAMLVCLAFCALFLAAYLLARRRAYAASETAVPVPFLTAAVVFPFVALVFAFVFLFFPSVAAQPGLLFGFVFLADACLLAVAWCDEQTPKLHLGAGSAVFAFLFAWTGLRLTADLLPWALAAYLLHAILHTAFPVLLERRRPAAAPAWWSQIFPPLALLLLLVPLFKLDAISVLFWPAVLLVDALAVGLALATGSLAVVAAVLVLTLLATGVWIFQLPLGSPAEWSVLLVVGGFALLFFGAGLFLARRLGAKLDPANGNVRAQLPAFSALLPFLLLIMMTQRLPLAQPSPVFGLALLLVALTLGLAVIFTLEWLPACALGGAVALEYAWHVRHFDAASPGVALGWYVGFFAVFAAFPFVFRRRFAAHTGPWAIAALASVVHFPLVYNVVDRAWPNELMGLIPALFAVPALVSLALVLRSPAPDKKARLNQLAWFGGVALLFVTLIFPIQFERQWLTLAWAFEGTALLWLFHRVPHPALRATGAVLLGAAFARLALNVEVLAYHARSDVPIFNWYLYTYGLAIACLFAAARLAAPPRERIFGLNAPPIFQACATVLAFLLLNLEIADFFSTPGQSVLTFDFSGNFARDMTYTIAWALFALGLLLVAIWKRARPGRYAALALLGVVLLKLFFHDLARLEALYRIGALFAVAVIATVASLLYQRFLPAHAKDSAAQP